MPSPTCLVLEDQPERIRYFRSVLHKLGERPVVCSTVDAAMALLSNEMDSSSIYSLFLDNDLGDNQKPGTALASWIIEHGKCKAYSITIHSMNVVASMHMAAILAGKAATVQRIPFDRLQPLLDEMAEERRLSIR